MGQAHLILKRVAGLENRLMEDKHLCRVDSEYSLKSRKLVLSELRSWTQHTAHALQNGIFARVVRMLFRWDF